MKLTNIRGTEPHAVSPSGTGETPGTSRASTSTARRSRGLSGALENLSPALSPSHKPAVPKSPRRSLQSPPNAPGATKTGAGSRLVDLMHAERPTDLTTGFLAREAHQATTPPPVTEISILPPDTDSPASGQSPVSGRSRESATRLFDAGSDSIRWAADSQPTNLLWQKIGPDQKQQILAALSDRNDLAGVALWERADNGDIRAMDKLDDHLLLHYYKDESGNANPLRFAPREGRGVPRETTPTDTRAYMHKMQPLLDAHREKPEKKQTSAAQGNGGWLNSLFKKGNKRT